MLPTFGTGAMAGKPITDTQGFGIPSKADEKETAAAFIDFMHSPERLQAMWTTSKQIPADTRFDASVIDDPFIKSVYDTWVAGSTERLHRRPDAGASSGPTPCSSAPRRSWPAR